MGNSIASGGVSIISVGVDQLSTDTPLDVRVIWTLIFLSVSLLPLVPITQDSHGISYETVVSLPVSAILAAIVVKTSVYPDAILAAISLAFHKLLLLSALGYLSDKSL